MAIKVEEVLEFLAIKDTPEDIDKFKEAFSKDFVAKSQALLDPDISAKAASKLGERFGKVEHATRQKFKDFGIDKVEGDKLEEIIESGFATLKTKFEAEKETGKKSKSDREKELETELEKIKGLYGSEKTRADKANELFETEKKGRTEFETNFKIQDQLKGALEKVPFTEEYRTKEYAREGYLTLVAKKMKIALDDKGVAVPLKPDGTPFTNPAGNENKSLVEVLTDFADELKLKANNKTNPAASRQANPERKEPAGQEKARFLDRSRK